MKENSTAAQAVQPGRIFWPDALRVACIFAVMVIHQAATGYTDAPAGSASWAICLAYNTAARFAVPGFVMISGAMHLDASREVTMTHLFQKIKKLAVAFLFWSAAYGLAGALQEHRFFTTNFIRSVMERIATGHYHMWYIFLIAALYLLTPLLRVIASDRKRLCRVLAAAFLLGFVPGNAGTLFTYIGYYCLGYALRSAVYSKKRAKQLCIASASAVVAATAAAVLSGRPELAFQEKMPHIILLSAGVFLAFRFAARKMEKTPAVKKIVETVAPCTFGMYLVHPALNFIFRKAGLYALTFSPLLCVPLCSMLVFVTGFAVIFIMRKIPLLRHMT